MQTRPRQPGPFDKQGVIISRLRGRVLNGTFPPGGRIPKRTELEEEFRVSPVTMQKAIDKLVADGFLYARGKAGTFVAERPPHLHRYGIIFSTHQRDSFSSAWPRYWAAITNEAKIVERQRNIQIEFFYGIGPNADGSERRRLLDDVAAHRLAGVIFPFDPRLFHVPEILANRELPVVTLGGSQAERRPVLAFDNVALIDRALDYLHTAGRTRIAVVGIPGFVIDQLAYFQAAIAKRGMTTRKYWTLSVNNGTPQTARTVMHLLMNANQRERPDGLIILDDNLVEDAVAGIVDAGITCPAELDVVGHCNFPWPPLTTVPVKRLGFDCAWLVRRAIDMIDSLRRNETLEEVTSVRPVFDHELPAAISGSTTSHARPAIGSRRSAV